MNIDEFRGLTQDEFLEKAKHLSSDQLTVLRRRMPPCEVDELGSGREPRPGYSAMGGPSRLTCALFVIVPPAVLLLTYLFEIYRHY